MARPGFCRERWQFWKLRFSKVKDEVDKEVAEMAQQAIGAMEKAEKVTRKLKRDLDHLQTDTSSLQVTKDSNEERMERKEMRCLIF